MTLEEIENMKNTIFRFLNENPKNTNLVISQTIQKETATLLSVGFQFFFPTIVDQVKNILVVFLETFYFLL